ncbi:unnamed protein product, partial [Musa acuminata subsp. malaccensis]
LEVPKRNAFVAAIIVVVIIIIMATTAVATNPEIIVLQRPHSANHSGVEQVRQRLLHRLSRHPQPRATLAWIHRFLTTSLSSFSLLRPLRAFVRVSHRRGPYLVLAQLVRRRYVRRLVREVERLAGAAQAVHGSVVGPRCHLGRRERTEPQPLPAVGVPRLRHPFPPLPPPNPLVLWRHPLAGTRLLH